MKVDQGKFDECGTCVNVCPVGMLEIKEEKSHAFNPDEYLVCRAYKV